MDTIVIRIGGLHAGYLGPYGNAWIETPHWDRFAAAALTFDQCLAEHAALARAARSGAEHAPTGQPRETGSRLAERLRAHGVRTVLIRDPSCSAGAGAADEPAFDEVIRPPGAAARGAGPLFQAGAEWLRSDRPPGPSFLFLDAHGAHPPWQPAESYRARYEVPASPDPSGARGRADDKPEETIDAGPSRVPAPDDPAVRAARTLYAATVTQLDDELGTFLDALTQSDAWDNTMLLLTSDYGQPLGEHGVVGTDPIRLYEELVRVPLVVRLPGVSGPSSRSRALVTVADLEATVLEMLGLPIPADAEGRSLLPIARSEHREVREFACLHVAGVASALRTTQWHLILPVASPAGAEPELYAKPEDRWEQNNLARQCPEVVAELEAKLRAAEPPPGS